MPQQSLSYENLSISSLVPYPLGPELVLNGDFALGDNGDWGKVGESTVAVGSARIYSSVGVFSAIAQDILALNTLYHVKVIVDSQAVDGADIELGGGGILRTPLVVGVNEFNTTSDPLGTEVYIATKSGTSGDVTISYVSIREVL